MGGAAGDGQGFVSNVINFNPFLSQSIGDIHINGGAVSVPNLVSQVAAVTEAATAGPTEAPTAAPTKGATNAPVTKPTDKF